MTPRRAPPCAWKPGQSGNPKGKPKGATSSGALRDAIKKAMPQVLQAMIEKAIAGDVNAAATLARLAIPPLRAAEEPTPVQLAGGTLTEQGRAVLDAVARGELAPSQGQALLSSLADLARLRAEDDHESRLQAIEAANLERQGQTP